MREQYLCCVLLSGSNADAIKFCQPQVLRRGTTEAGKILIIIKFSFVHYAGYAPSLQTYAALRPVNDE